MNICIAPECERIIAYKKMCTRHYQQVNKLGRLYTDEEITQKRRMVGRRNGIQKGNIPWNKNTKGIIIPWNKGLIGVQKAWNKNLGLKIVQTTEYQKIHKWIKNNYPKLEKCEYCLENKKLDYANISQTYEYNIGDWVQLCRSCHNQYDSSIKLQLLESRG